MKIKGSELALFMENGWPGEGTEDWFWDSDDLDTDINHDSTYDTDELGCISYQGKGEDPTGGEGYSFAAAIKRWRRDRDFDILTVTVPKARGDEVRAALAKLNVRVKG
jgi:hypothetical protein